MFLRLPCDKDTYITNKLIGEQPSVDANVGKAGNLSLFKLYQENVNDPTIPVLEAVGGYGNLEFPGVELSRILIHFDLTDLRALWGTTIATDNTSFFCKLKLQSIYGGQTIPENFHVEVMPLYKNFDEGSGLDTTNLYDINVANFTSASYDSILGTISWEIPGAGNIGPVDENDTTADLDAITDLVVDEELTSLTSTQTFLTGFEDLEVDVTTQVKAMLNNQIPDSGFRISFISDEEENDRSYFIKHFAGQQSYLARLRPVLNVGYDSSIRDDRNAMYLDKTNRLYFVNYINGTLTDPIDSNSLPVDDTTLRLTLTTLDELFTQTFTTTKVRTGVFYADVTLSSQIALINNNIINNKVKFIEKWHDVTTITEIYKQGNLDIYYRNDQDAQGYSTRIHAVAMNSKSEYSDNENIKLQIFMSDLEQFNYPSRLKRIKETLVPTFCHLRIKDLLSGDIILDFDTTKNSTKISSNAAYLFYEFNTKYLYPSLFGVDLLVNYFDSETVIENICRFTVKD